MNFFRNFLQSKDLKAGEQSIKKNFSDSNLYSAKSDVYSLSTSVTDSSTCVSSERSDGTCFISKSDNSQTIRNDIIPVDFEKVEKICLSAPNTEIKDNKKFEIEDHLLQQNSDPDSVGKAPLLLKGEPRSNLCVEDDVSPIKSVESNFVDIAFNERISVTSEDLSASNFECSSDLIFHEEDLGVNFCPQGAVNTVCLSEDLSNKASIKSDAVDADCTVHQFEFKDSKIVQKPPDRFLGKKARNTQKKHKLNKQRTKNKGLIDVSSNKTFNTNIKNAENDEEKLEQSSTYAEDYLKGSNANQEKTVPERSSTTSVNCCESEEFEQLGNEANKIAEELTNVVKPCDLNFESMTSRSSTDECSNNLNSLSLGDEPEKMLTKRDSLLLQVGDSEAGPDIATGLTSSDLKCASEFFREAAELENQIRRNIASSVLNYTDFAVENDSTGCAFDTEIYLSSAKSDITSPPREERSAPEGTSSPDPKSLEDSEVRSRLQRSSNSFSPEVNELLKKQALEFEEKLLRQGIVAAEKEKELHEMLKEEQKHLYKVTASRDALLKLVEQYKGMLGSLVSEREKSSKGQEEKIKTMELEKQQASEDLSNVEAAFSDVHRKYERTKQIVDTLRRNEETLRTAVADYEQKLVKQERKYLELQKHAEEKIKLANEEFETLRRSNDQEMTKMSALLKKAEMKIISLQETLERKNRENQELTQLCDDLISKVGS